MLGQDRHRRTSRNDTEEVVPSASHAATVLLYEFLQGNRHLLLHDARLVDVSTDAEQLCALVALSAEASEPSGATTNDGRCDGDRLNVGNGGRATEQSDIGGERWLEPRLALLALDRLNQRGLFSANVRSGSAVKVHIEVVAGSACVLADVAGLVRFVDGLLNVIRLHVELATDVDVC